MFGWLRLARIWASRLNRARRSGSAAKASGRIFRATWRPSCVSVGLPDLAHAALADEGGDVVVAEAGADGQGHVLSGSITQLSPVRMTVEVVVRCESLHVPTIGIHDVDLELRIDLRLVRASIAT